LRLLICTLDIKLELTAYVKIPTGSRMVVAKLK